MSVKDIKHWFLTLKICECRDQQWTDWPEYTPVLSDSQKSKYENIHFVHLVKIAFSFWSHVT